MTEATYLNYQGGILVATSFSPIDSRYDMSRYWPSSSPPSNLRGGILTIQVKWLPHGPLYRTSPGIRTQPPIVVVLLQSVPLMRSVQFFESSKSVVTHKPTIWPFQIGSHGKPTKSFCHPNHPTSSVYISEKRSVVKKVISISTSYLNIQHK